MLKPTLLRILGLFILATLSSGVLKAQQNQTLTVFAASSLTDAFGEIGDAFTVQNQDVDIVFNFASSTTLAVQLAEGAPADVFASANRKQMQAAIDAGRMVEPAQIFARNRLVLIVPADNPAGVETLHDLAKPGLMLVLAAPKVPIRDYTDTMLDKLAAEADYGPDYKAAVLANVVSEEDNVRQVVAKVALGEAQAGIVYQSDVTSEMNDLVLAIPIPDAYNTIATYPIAITNDSADRALAQAFVDFVLSEDGQAILQKWNFIGKCPAVSPEATPEMTPEPAEAGCS